MVHGDKSGAAGEPDQVYFRGRLLTWIGELEEQAATSSAAGQTVELDQTRVGRVSRIDALQAQAMSQETERRRRLQLVEAKRALGKLDQGEFGYCESCDESIARGRLEANLAVRLCIRCAGKAESDKT